ncbi:MAG: glycoside hydrolase family 2 TIM barrel-domain containing protein [Flavobacteriales bacterium]
MRISFLLVFFFSVFSLFGQARKVTSFNADWEFYRDDLKGNQSPVKWEKVSLPHTARLESKVVISQFQGDCVYRKSFQCPLKKDEKAFLYFEGVMMNAAVYLNGKWMTTHEGGYLPFTVDLTPELKNGINTIEVRVNNEDHPQIPPGKPLKELDFNYYGGIYRNVKLIKTNAIHITDPIHENAPNSGGIFVNFNSFKASTAKAQVFVHLKNETKKKASIRIETTISDGKGYSNRSITSNVEIAPLERQKIETQAVVSHAELWSPSHPFLYNLTVKVFKNNQLVDEQRLKVGIRFFELKEDGFYLNGSKYELTGTNRHQEYPYVGYALSDNANWRDAVLIKNAGFNFVRLSHYPQSESFLDACDELGLIVMDCLPGWQFMGDTTFQLNVQQNLRDMIRRDRNRTCVLFWENSLNETWMEPSFTKQLNAILDEEFPYYSISCSWIDDPSYDLFIPARQHAKAPVYWNAYENGTKHILVAEYGDWEYYAQNAGFQQSTFADLKEEERTSRQLRAAGEKRLLQQAFNFQEASNSNQQGKQIIGQANWLMFDYNRGYSPDLESSGIADIYRIPKFAYHFYQSQAEPSDSLQDPRVESGYHVFIANYWTANSPLDVTIYSNVEEVELYLNDSLIGRQKPTINSFSNYLNHPPFHFQVSKFVPGKLTAVGYMNNSEVAFHQVFTPGSPNGMNIEVVEEGIPISKDQMDLVFVRAFVTSNEILVPTAEEEFTFKIIKGKNASLIGENPVKSEAGIASILMKTEGFQEEIQIEASSPKLGTMVFILTPEK